MKKKILLCLIAQLICWSIMTMSDYMEETYNDSFNLIVVFAVPLMCVVLYALLQEMKRKFCWMQKIKEISE